MTLDLSPAPGAARPARRVWAQTLMELRLTLRNGEVPAAGAKPPPKPTAPPPQKDPRMLAGGGRTLAVRERAGGGTVAGRPAAGSTTFGTTLGMFGPVADRAMRVVISSSPADCAGGRMDDGGATLRFTCDTGFPPSLPGDD